MNGPPPLRIEDREIFHTLAAIELNSIAQGVETLDAILKEAPVRVLLGEPSSPGKYLILFTGEVDEASRSLRRSIEIAGETLVDELLLPAAAPGLQDALRGEAPAVAAREGEDLPALGLLETYTGPSLLGAADTAVKTGETTLLDLHLLSGIGGKATALLAGDVESVRVAITAGAAFAEERGLLARRVVIPRPDRGMAPFLRRGAARSRQ
ncbi:MAG: BMC domain-containing protein [Planctomycetota bacterium]